jgi:hypothetical protein
LTQVGAAVETEQTTALLAVEAGSSTVAASRPLAIAGYYESNSGVDDAGVTRVLTVLQTQ